MSKSDKIFVVFILFAAFAIGSAFSVAVNQKLWLVTIHQLDGKINQTVVTWYSAPRVYSENGVLYVA